MNEWFDPELWARWSPELKSALRIITIVLGAWVVQWLLVRLIRRMRMRFEAHARSADAVRWVVTVARVLRYALRVLLTVLVVMLVLNELGVSIAPLLGAAGVVGIAVGFGAQSLIKDYFNGFFLLVENQIRVGDVVRIADKGGLVEEVSLRRVRLRDYDGSVHYVPNGLITTVTNLSTEFAYALMDISIAYPENVERAIAVLRDVARELRASPNHTARILDDIDIAGVEELGDYAIKLRCRIKVQPLEQWTIKREFLKRIKERFAREGIEIPYPHQTLVLQRGRPRAAERDGPVAGTPGQVKV
jgi:small conductance mechanosensitive channel